MIKKIEVAGVSLDNNTVRESLILVGRMMEEPAFTTIEEIDMDMVLMAEANGHTREIIHSLDHTIISEVGILDAVGENNIQRRHEISERDFFYGFFKRLERNAASVFVLGADMESVEKTEEILLEQYPRLKIVGKEALENCVGTQEAVVNEINVASADVILSVIPSPAQEYFLEENRGKMSSRIWYGTGDHPLKKKKKRVTGIISSLAKKKKIQKFMNNKE